MELSSGHIYHTTNWQIWTTGKKVTAPQVGGDVFTEIFSIEQLIAYFWTLNKSYNITLLPLEL
jgi:hypothetical protein